MIPGSENNPPAVRGDGWYVGGFVLANLALKLALVNFNGGSYTDGIIQLQTSGHGPLARLGLYPPLYGEIAQIVSKAGVPLELAGRAVSAVAGSLALVPVFLMTR
jgi:hypothetical protein